jgi:hypothetical protein
MLKFETFITYNNKTEILKEFTEYNLKIDNDNYFDKNFDLEIDKINDNFGIKEKYFTAVPLPKNGNV